MTDLRFIAFHEAGHAVAQHRLGFTCIGCTIERRGDVLGVSSSLDGDTSFATLGADGVYEIPEEVSRSFLIVKCAGYCAQVEAGDAATNARAGAEDDFDGARELRESRLQRRGRDRRSLRVRARSEELASDRDGGGGAARTEEPRRHRGLDVGREIADGEATSDDLRRYRAFRAQARN